jgi:hypothetical protein
VFGELYGYPGKLWGAEVEAEGASTCLSMVAHLQWRTTVRSGGDPTTGKVVSNVQQNPGQLFEEEGSKGLTGGGGFWTERRRGYCSCPVGKN